MADVAEYKCPNCNAPLLFDKDRQVYVCEYCDTEFRDKAAPAQAEPAEKKVIYEYHHINVPEEASAGKREVQSQPSGLLRIFLLLSGIFCVLMGVAGFSTEHLGLAIAFLCLGIWLLAQTHRRK